MEDNFLQIEIIFRKFRSKWRIILNIWMDIKNEIDKFPEIFLKILFILGTDLATG